jgi:hypothetical protein
MTSFGWFVSILKIWSRRFACLFSTEQSRDILTDLGFIADGNYDSLLETYSQKCKEKLTVFAHDNVTGPCCYYNYKECKILYFEYKDVSFYFLRHFYLTKDWIKNWLNRSRRSIWNVIDTLRYNLRCSRTIELWHNLQTVEVGHYLVEVEVEVEESYYKESAILLPFI